MASTEQGPVLGFAGVCLFLVLILSREVNFCKRAASGLKVILVSLLGLKVILASLSGSKVVLASL